MKIVTTMLVLLACTACAHTDRLDRDDRLYRQFEYRETVYMPATEACERMGGFMIFEDPGGHVGNPDRLTYADMRLAVARGCAGT